jgi:RNA-directed DNA polymerase
VERDYNNKGFKMKRHGNLYTNICSIENLILADGNARQGKKDSYGVKQFDKRTGCNFLTLHNMLMDGTYTTGDYKTFKIWEPKEREISVLDYFPHRIVHHAIMVPLERIFTELFTADTYSCIKGKGIHAAADAVKKALKNVRGTKFSLKLDIKKFYPSIDHETLKGLLKRKFKDAKLLQLLFGIIESAPGVPIGNYLSQYFANFYLTPFDRWIKQTLKVANYFRYADDIVILSDSKAYLHAMLTKITDFLHTELKLTVKSNYQVFPVLARGIDFVGYVFRHYFTLIRKSIKQAFACMVARRKNPASIGSYFGWLKHCNSFNLTKKLIPNEHCKLRRIGDRTTEYRLCG